MLRVRPTSAFGSNHSHVQKPSSLSAARHTFSEARERQRISTPPKSLKEYEITVIKRFPPIERIDLQYASKSVRDCVQAAQELAQKKQVAFEGPPSDTLESLLAMRIKK